MPKFDENSFKEVVVNSLSLAPGAYRADLALGDVEAWDSLGHLSLIFAIESHFGIKFEMESIPELRTLPLIRAELVKKGVA
jgi:acyl carrier protein